MTLTPTLLNDALEIFSFLLILIVFLIPIYVGIKTKHLFVSFGVSSLLLLVLAFAVTYFTDELKNSIIYAVFHFDESAMSYDEQMKNVNEIDAKEINELYESTFGIGWPLRALFRYFILFPYCILVNLFIFLYRITVKHKKFNIRKI